MAAEQIARVPVTPRYRDLASELTKHTWLVVVYAVGSVIFLYLLGFTANANALFIAAEVPAVCMVTAVLRHDPRLSVRVPLVWCATAAFMWAIPKSPVRDGMHFGWTNEIMAWSLTLLFGYWLVRAVKGSIVESKREQGESAAVVIANLLSLWGATLTIIRVASLVIPVVLLATIEPTKVGGVLVRIFAIADRVSLWNWLPPGLLLFGLALFASLRFSDDPYRPPNYQEILSIRLLPVLNELFATLRLPVWLCVVVIGFLLHFIKQVWLSFAEFVNEWVGRICLIFFSLILPTALICLAHFILLMVTGRIARYLSGDVTTLNQRVVLLLAVHFEILLGMSLYIIAVVASALEIVPLPVRRIPKVVKSFIKDTGFPAGNAVGRSFSLYGMFLIAVPIASTLPRGPRFGLFSIVYGSIVILAAPIAAYRKAKEDARIKALGIEVIALRLFESGSATEPDKAKSYSNKFVRNEVRSVFWELSLRNLPPTHVVPLDITAEWSRTTGEIVEKRVCRRYVDSGSTTCDVSDGLGSDMLGQLWIPGTYNLRLYVGSKMIAHAPFEINEIHGDQQERATRKYPKRNSLENVTAAKPWHKRHSGILGLVAGLIILGIAGSIGVAVVHVIQPHPAMWLKACLYIWAVILAFLSGLLGWDILNRGRIDRGLVLTGVGLTLVFALVLLVVGIARRINTNTGIPKSIDTPSRPSGTLSEKSNPTIGGGKESGNHSHEGVSSKISVTADLVDQMAKDILDVRDCLAHSTQQEVLASLDTEMLPLSPGQITFSVSGTGREPCSLFGARMPMQWIYEKTGKGYRQLLDVGPVDGISILDGEHMGYKDLRLSGVIQAGTAMYEETYIFDGHEYHATGDGRRVPIANSRKL